MLQETIQIIAILAVFLPLCGFLIYGFGTRYKKPLITELVTSFLVSLAAICSVILFYHIHTSREVVHIQLFRWIDVGDLSVYWSIYVDILSASMFCLVNIVSSVVHIYSKGYMHEDPNRDRFFAYLSLFTFFMLMLVSADNFLQLFFGWEGVGLASYLLIGFWYSKKSATDAAIKAFITNRVGDVGLVLGLSFLFWYSGSLNYADIFLPENVNNLVENTTMFMGMSLIDTLCLFLFIGAIGKSAQFFLHVWLPDAMEGPTPVSALIHAATMVTAGVFLLARSSYLFEYAHFTRDIILVIGSITCIFAATVALVQQDIKKIIAYSTCSQLGYMFMACGVASYSTGVFHLITHGFFKALLFLGAGSVIHAVANEQNIFRMGNLASKLPKSHILMLVGSLALAGIWPFAGYYSKDSIIESIYLSSSNFGGFAYFVSMFVAFLTAFYSFRLLMVVFFGKDNVNPETHTHESPNIMILPLVILGIGAIFVGIWSVKSLNILNLSFWQDAIFYRAENTILSDILNVSLIVKYSPLVLGIAGIVSAIIIYSRSINEKIAGTFLFTHKLLLNKYYIDEIYDVFFVKSTWKLGKFFDSVIDSKLIDKYIVNGIACILLNFSLGVRIIQTGYVYHYGLMILLGILAIIYVLF